MPVVWWVAVEYFRLEWNATYVESNRLCKQMAISVGFADSTTFKCTQTQVKSQISP